MDSQVHLPRHPLDLAASWAGYRCARFRLCLAGVFVGELALHLIAPQRIREQLLVVALAFAAAYSLSVLIPPVREEARSFRKLLGHFGFAGEAA